MNPSPSQSPRNVLILCWYFQRWHMVAYGKCFVSSFFPFPFLFPIHFIIVSCWLLIFRNSLKGKSDIYFSTKFFIYFQPEFQATFTTKMNKQHVKLGFAGVVSSATTTMNRHWSWTDMRSIKFIWMCLCVRIYACIVYKHWINGIECRKHKCLNGEQQRPKQQLSNHNSSIQYNI